MAVLTCPRDNRMPKRKLAKPLPETLAAIKRAREHGIPVSEAEIEAVRRSAYRVPTPDLPFGAEVSWWETGKKGEFRVWFPDHPKGPGSTELPLERALRELERDWQTQVVKDMRKASPVPKEPASVRRARSSVSAIQSALRELGLENRDACARIAKKLGITAARVRQVRKEMKATEGPV